MAQRSIIAIALVALIAATISPFIQAESPPTAQGAGAVSNDIITQVKCLVTCAAPCRRSIFCYLRCINQCFVCVGPPLEVLNQMDESAVEENLGLNHNDVCKFGCILSSAANNLNMNIEKQGEMLPASTDAQSCEELCEKERLML
ncbi:hypothetical protein Dimus_009458 [Dionaea muscipula]